MPKKEPGVDSRRTRRLGASRCPWVVIPLLANVIRSPNGDSHLLPKRARHVGTSCRSLTRVSFGLGAAAGL